MTDLPDRWPTATVDRVARLRVLAAGMPGSHLDERVIAADFESVWATVADLETSGPAYDTDVHSVKVLARDGERWRIRARLAWWAATLPVPFDVTMRDGWCLMVSRPQLYVIGIAAEPHPAGTRLAHLEGVNVPSPRWARLLLRPTHAISRWRHRRHVPRDVDRLEAYIRQRMRAAGS